MIPQVPVHVSRVFLLKKINNKENNSGEKQNFGHNYLIFSCSILDNCGRFYFARFVSSFFLNKKLRETVTCT